MGMGDKYRTGWFLVSKRSVVICDYTCLQPMERVSSDHSFNLTDPRNLTTGQAYKEEARAGDRPEKLHPRERCI